MFWEVMGTLRWGIMCCGMMQRFGWADHLDGARDDRAAIVGDEIDLLRLLSPRGG
jgi:hypothetical protein